MDGAAGPQPGPRLGERFGDFGFLIRDRGSNFTASFDAVFQAADITPAPGLLDRTLVLNQAHLRAVLAEYQEHYHTARPHQGIGQRIPNRAHEEPPTTAASLDP